MTREFPLTVDRLLADLSPATDVHANRELTGILNLLTVQVQLHDPGREHLLPLFYGWARLSHELRTLHDAAECWLCFSRKLWQCSATEHAQMNLLLGRVEVRRFSKLGVRGYVWLHMRWLPWVASMQRRPVAKLVDRALLCALVYGACKVMIWLAQAGRGGEL